MNVSDFKHRRAILLAALFCCPCFVLNAANLADLMAESTEIGSGWYYSSWFGYYEVHDDPHAAAGQIYHNEHGDLWVLSSVGDGWWMTPQHASDSLETIYFTSSTYPTIYLNESGAWGWYLPGSSPSRWIVVYTTEQWKLYPSLLKHKPNGPNGEIPLWWKQYSMLNLNSVVSNYSPVNMGQLKHVLKQTKSYLDNKLGLNPLLWSAAYAGYGGNPFPLPAGNTDSNHSMVNLGQLKYLASGVYEILNHVNGYDVIQDHLVPMGVSSSYWSGGGSAFPWSPSTPGSENYAPVTIGQLKLVFAFSLDEATDPFLDFSGTGVNDAQPPLPDLDEDLFSPHVENIAGQGLDGYDDSSNWPENPALNSALSGQGYGLVIVIPWKGPHGVNTSNLKLSHVAY